MVSSVTPNDLQYRVMWRLVPEGSDEEDCSDGYRSGQLSFAVKKISELGLIISEF